MYLLIVIFIALPEVNNFLVTNGSEYQESRQNNRATLSEFYSDQPGCYNRFVGSRGSVQNLVFPGQSLSPMVCEWDIDVTRGFVVDLEFEVFRLPVNKEQRCDSYLEISYSPSQDEVVKRVVCPTDMVKKISTGSQTVNIHFKSGELPKDIGNQTYGFKINYIAVSVITPSGNQALKVVLFSFGTLLVIGAFFCCFHKCYKSKRKPNIPINGVTSEQPNAPTRAELQSAFEIQRHVLQAPQMQQKYLSRTSSLNSNAASRKTMNSNIELRKAIAKSAPFVPSIHEKPKISIGSTPHLMPTGDNKIWSSESIRRIQNLRTRLVARFSSPSSSDVSVFYDAPDRSSYTQLNCEDDQSPDENHSKEDNVVVRPNAKSQNVPSILIEFVD